MTPQPPLPEPFDFDGWQRVAQFAGSIFAALLGAWAFVSKIWAPYKVKRDIAKAKRAAEAAKQLEDALRKILAAELTRLDAVCASAADCAERWERVTEHLDDFDEAMDALVYMSTENHMLAHDLMRVQRLALQIPEPPSTAEGRETHTLWHERRARVIAGIEHRAEERERLRGDRRGDYPTRRTPPRAGGRRSDDPPEPRAD